jgi:hypothetical protein
MRSRIAASLRGTAKLAATTSSRALAAASTSGAIAAVRSASAFRCNGDIAGIPAGCCCATMTSPASNVVMAATPITARTLGVMRFLRYH